jgi:hypothetical protein
MRVAIYTACFGNYDNLCKPIAQTIPCDWLVWGDLHPSKTNGWTLQQPIVHNLGNSVLNARAVKVLSHWHVPQYDYVIWIDGAMTVTSKNFADWCISQTTDWALYGHPCRHTVDSEVLECRRLGFHVNPASLERYKAEGFHDNVLYATTSMCRRPTKPIVEQLECRWMNELLLTSPRDQISLPYCFWKECFIPDVLEATIYVGPFHAYHGHKQPWRRGNVVHQSERYMQPG